LANQAFACTLFEPPEEVRQQLFRLERDLDGEALHTQLVISLDGSSRIKEGDEAEIWVDAEKIHRFDPPTAENLTVNPSSAGTIPSDTSTEKVAEAQDSIATPGEQEAATEA